MASRLSYVRRGSSPVRRTLPPVFRSLAPALLLAVGIPAVPGEGAAQIPDEFTNLEVLPEDIGRRELVATMRGFAGALGVRCNHCHVGEDPNDLEGYDFASDDKETKRVARAMMRMVSEINGRLLPETGRENLLEVKCITCHGGIDKPQTLHDALLATYEEEGVDAAVAEYRRLRETYYGSAAYDFSPRSLNQLTETLAQSGDLDAALVMVRLNLEHYPDAAHLHFLEGQVLVAKGDTEAGVRSIERAIELAPDEPFYQQQLERIRGQ